MATLSGDLRPVSYGVDAPSDADIPLILAMTVAIDSLTLRD